LHGAAAEVFDLKTGADPMPSNRFQVTFQSTETYGWTENYWYNGTLDDATLRPLTAQFVLLRCAFLTQDVFLTRIKVVGQFKRDPLIFDFTGVPGAKGQIAEEVNNSSGAVQVRMQSSAVGYNKVFMRGLPDSMVTGDVFTPGAPWITGFNAFKAFLMSSGVFLVVANVDNPQPVQLATSMAPHFPKGITVTMPAGYTPPTKGQQLRITGSSIIGYNGTKTCVVAPTLTSPLTFIVGGARPQQPPNGADTLSVQLKVPKEGAIETMFAGEYMQRKPGRPFGLVRGRRQTTLSLRP
jgi:hypothetical protein